ncbi:hypothetical protein Patl1_27014 [Pistacia atlantica]|uniref:Uncharacterized protein n=1 Tax=Pistacia atlantica TaxID=434234 RepID=A0ACC1B4C9_9ROSI|nr:hypothetical protein Patl1_27014 [Pistacia atlantica]
MTSFLNQTPYGGSAQVDDDKLPLVAVMFMVNNVYEDNYANVLVMGGHIISTTVAILVQESCRGYEGNYNCCHELQPCYYNQGSICQMMWLSSHYWCFNLMKLPMVVVLWLTTDKLPLVVVMSMIVHHRAKLQLIILHSSLRYKRVVGDYESNYNYCHRLQPCYCNWAPYGKRVGCLVTVGVLIVEGWHTPSGGSDVHDSPSLSQTSTDNTSFFSTARSLSPKVDDRQTLSGGSDVHDSPPPSQTSTDNTSFFSAARSLTRGVMRATTIVAMGFSLVIATGLHMPNEVVVWSCWCFNLLRVDAQTLSGGSDVHDSPPPSQTSTDNTSFFSAERSLTRVVNNVHEDKYANVLVMGGHIISTTAAVLATNCKSEMSSRAKYLLYFLISLLVYCPISMLYFFGYKRVVGVMRAVTIVAMGFSLVIATGLHMPSEVVVWSLLVF